MKTNLEWKAGLVLGLLATGCGMDESPSPPAASVEAVAASPSPAPLPSPPSAAEEPEKPVEPSGWQVTPEPAPMTFEVPACLPVKAMSGRRFAHRDAANGVAIPVHRHQGVRRLLACFPTAQTLVLQDDLHLLQRAQRREQVEALEDEAAVV